MKAKMKAIWDKVRNYIIKEEKIKIWLLHAVICAEKELGSGTGKVKLSAVYDMFIQRFPVLSKFISFNTFSRLVDEVLITMKEMLKNNEGVKNYVL